MKYDLISYKAIVFDFDGVILDSEQFKIVTFKSLFTDYLQCLSLIDEYNRKNRGISRYEKFAYIFKEILHLPYDEEVGKRLGERYSQLLSQNLAETPLIAGVKEFLVRQKVPLFVASSSGVYEIQKVVEAKDIERFFTKLYGHPISKSDAIRDLMATNNLAPARVLFFGDAVADWKAADETKVEFIARTDQPELFPKGTRTVSTFLELLA